MGGLEWDPLRARELPHLGSQEGGFEGFDSSQGHCA